MGPPLGRRRRGGRYRAVARALGRRGRRGRPRGGRSRCAGRVHGRTVRPGDAPRGSWASFATWAVGLLDHYLRPDGDPGRWPDHEEAAARQVRAASPPWPTSTGCQAGPIWCRSAAPPGSNWRGPSSISTSSLTGLGRRCLPGPLCRRPGAAIPHRDRRRTGRHPGPAAGPGDGLLGDAVSALDPSGTLLSRRTARSGSGRPLVRRGRRDRGADRHPASGGRPRADGPRPRRGGSPT